MNSLSVIFTEILVSVLGIFFFFSQAPLYVRFSRQEYRSGLLCPPPGDLPDPGIKPASLMSAALTGEFFTGSATWEALNVYKIPANVC